MPPNIVTVAFVDFIALESLGALAASFSEYRLLETTGAFAWELREPILRVDEVC